MQASTHKCFRLHLIRWGFPADDQVDPECKGTLLGTGACRDEVWDEVRRAWAVALQPRRTVAPGDDLPADVNKGGLVEYGLLNIGVPCGEAELVTRVEEGPFF